LISSDFEKLLALIEDFTTFHTTEVLPKLQNHEVTDLMSMRTKYDLYMKMLNEVKYLEEISDVDFIKRHPEI
jgi:hypothetical protein